jgi:hypothetical protein
MREAEKAVSRDWPERIWLQAIVIFVASLSVAPSSMSAVSRSFGQSEFASPACMAPSRRWNAATLRAWAPNSTDTLSVMHRSSSAICCALASSLSRWSSASAGAVDRVRRPNK